jgi:hypothetical protein
LLSGNRKSFVLQTSKTTRYNIRKVVKLYRQLTDNPELCGRLEPAGIPVQPQKCLDLAAFWADHRGVHHTRSSSPQYEYAQDHCIAKEHSRAVGHAVWAALLYAGIESDSKNLFLGRSFLI